ncbi:fe3+ abc transporter periplasmic protein [Fusarium avenaceum]|nr:fe3+ abc transporter periplasmic protein [Fusarium avenaceum]
MLINSITFFFLAIQSVAQAVGDEHRSLAEIYQDAKKETGTLNVYSGGSTSRGAQPLLDAFSKQFPGIKVNITVELSKYADSRIDRSYIDGEPFIDYAMLQTVHDFPRWKKEGRLLNYKPINFGDVNASIKDPDGAFFPVSYNQFGPFYYDSDRVPANKVPKTYADVLDPYWKGKIVLTYPNDDDGVLYQFKLIIQKYGFKWLDALLKQDIKWVRGATLATGTIIQDHSSNGPRVLTFSGLGVFTPSTTFLKTAKPEAPDRFMTWAQQSAIFKSTPRPNSAKLLASFLLSDSWQKNIATSGAPTVRDSLTGANNVFKANNTEPLGYAKFMNDRQDVEWWRMQMETQIGLAVGPDPALP